MAASSSVGIAALQIANVHHAVPIAVTRGRGKAAALLDVGAAHVIVSDEEDVAARIRALTGGKGARIAFDAVGGAMLSALAGAMAPKGIIISYGILAGPPTDFPIVSLLAGNLTLRGWSADMLTQDPKLRAEVVAYVSEGIAAVALQPVVDRCFDLLQVVDAYRYLESNTQFGKILITTRSAMD